MQKSAYKTKQQEFLLSYLSKMQEFRDAIADYDEAKIAGLIHEANKIKKILR